MTFKRIIWQKYLLVFASVSFVAMSIYITTMYFVAGKKDLYLLIIGIVLIPVSIFFIVLTILDFCKKRDAIILKENRLIVRNYKEREIRFSEIKDIRYLLSSGGGTSPRGTLFGVPTYKSGTINIYLNDGSVIHVKDIKDVHDTCITLRNKILK